MKAQEIKSYLRKHFSLVFRYNSEYYSLQRIPSLFCSRYSLIATDGLLYQGKSLNKVFEKAHISKGTPLSKAIQYIEIPGENDTLWKTYEAVRHSAIVYQNEIHFLYNGKSYWIAHTSKGASHLSDNLGHSQSFSSCRSLFEDARINGSTLKEIWEKVVVDAC